MGKEMVMKSNPYLVGGMIALTKCVLSKLLCVF